jgi:hypothetical protein
MLVAAACGSGGTDKTVQGDLNLDPVRTLAGAAASDAQEMNAHADAMTAAAAQRPDHAHWAADAETIRADARTLSFVADAAQSIARDPGSHPGNAVELMRVYGDGTNLQQLGRSLVDHGAAMTTHIAVMRDEAAGDAELLKLIDAFAPNVEAMKVDGQAAIDRGTELIQEARRLAASVGVELPSGE